MKLDNKMIALLEEYMGSATVSDKLYDLNEIIDYFLEEYESESDYQGMRKIGSKIALLYASICLELSRKSSHREYEALSLFKLGEVLMTLGIPIYAHLYLKKSLLIFQEIEHIKLQEIVENHIAEVKRRCVDKVKQHKEFSGIKEMETVELNDFSEIYEEATEYLETNIIYRLAIQNKNKVIFSILNEIVGFSENNRGQLQKSTVLCMKVLSLIRMLLDNSENRLAVGLIIRISGVTHNNEQAIFKTEFKKIIDGYALPLFLLDKDIKHTDLLSYFLDLESKNSAVKNIPKQIKAMKAENYIFFVVIMSFKILPTFLNASITELDENNKEHFLKVIFTAIINSIEKCTTQKEIGTSELIDEDPDKYLMLNIDELEIIRSYVDKSSNLWCSVGIIISISRASSYLSRSITASYVAQETRYSIANQAREDEFIAVKLSIQDYESGVRHAEKALIDLINYFDIDITSIKNTIGLNEVFYTSQLPDNSKTSGEHTFSDPADALEYIQNIWAPKVRELEAIEKNNLYENHKSQEFDFKSFSLLLDYGFSSCSIPDTVKCNYPDLIKLINPFINRKNFLENIKEVNSQIS